MVSALAREDWEELRERGLRPTLDDFDRLNQIALRLTDGAETTAANFPRVGWAGDVPFFQPTCAAFAWYLQFAERATGDSATRNLCWFYALAHGRTAGAFDALVAPADILAAVKKWADALPVTLDEVARACRFAARGFDDAEPATATNGEATANGEERQGGELTALGCLVTNAAALTGLAPQEAERETPSRLAVMIDAVKGLHGFGLNEGETARRRADYQLTKGEIVTRLKAEKAAREAAAEATAGGEAE